MQYSVGREIGNHNEQIRKFELYKCVIGIVDFAWEKRLEALIK